jgi:hypothetical protein
MQEHCRVGRQYVIGQIRIAANALRLPPRSDILCRYDNSLLAHETYSFIMFKADLTQKHIAVMVIKHTSF